MYQLVRELSEQHLELLAMTYGIEGDAETKWRRFKEFEKAVLAHLTFEDQVLYPLLEDIEAHEKHIQVTAHAKEFFLWWPGPNSILSPEFKPSLDTFISDLVDRMKYEEANIFTLVQA